MKETIKKHWPWLLSLLFLLAWLCNGTDSASKWFQNLLGTLYGKFVALVSVVVFFFVLGEVLLAVFDLPVLLVVGIIIALSWLSQSLWNWFQGLFTAGNQSLSIVPVGGAFNDIPPPGSDTINLPGQGTNDYTAPTGGTITI